MATEQDYWNQMYANACDQNEVLSLRQQLSETEEFCKGEMARSAAHSAKLRQQRDDHLKREVMLLDAATRAHRKLSAYVGVCTGDKELTNTIIPMLKEALATTTDLDGLILCHAEPCRDDGRCQYAIDHGAEGTGHCPEGKCCTPRYSPKGLK